MEGGQIYCDMEPEKSVFTTSNGYIHYSIGRGSINIHNTHWVRHWIHRVTSWPSQTIDNKNDTITASLICQKKYFMLSENY